MSVEVTVYFADQRVGSHVVEPGEFWLGSDATCDLRVIASAPDAAPWRARLICDGHLMTVADFQTNDGGWGDGAMSLRPITMTPPQRVEIGPITIEANPHHQLDHSGGKAAAASAVPQVPPASPDAPAGSRKLRFYTATRPSPFAMPAETEAPAEPKTVGDLLKPRNYQFGSRIGQGGMGSILSAKDLNLRRPIAVKVMRPEKQAAPTEVVRFMAEAQVIAQLEHPNIVPIHELGMDELGRVFYTMKFVNGVTLAEVLEQFRNVQASTLQQYSLSRLLIIFQKVCDAVAFAHSRGVAHCDLKPDNIMIGDYGEVLVMDWGLARVLPRQQPLIELFVATGESATTDGAPPADGSVRGTPHYMAPEQAAGRDAEIDERTDVFALGAILYTILTMHPPVKGRFRKGTEALLHTGTVPAPTAYSRLNVRRRKRAAAKFGRQPWLDHYSFREIPLALAAVAMKALAHDPADRYQSVNDLQQDIDAYQSGFATTAEQASALKQLWLLIRRNQIAFAVISVMLALLALVMVNSFLKISAEKDRAQATLADLKITAPNFAVEARRLVQERHLDEALQKTIYALKLAPQDAAYHNLQGDTYQVMLRLPQARDAYSRAIHYDNGNLHAKLNLQLCQELLRENQGHAELPPQSLHRLAAALRQQNRLTDAEIILKQLLADKPQYLRTWRTILQRAGITDKLDTMLVDDDGRFTLDLSHTTVTDLTPIRGMAVKELDLGHTKITDLSALRGAPLLRLNLENCNILTALSPLADCPQLEILIIPRDAGDIEFLRHMPNLQRLGYAMPPSHNWYEVPLVADFWKARDASK